MCLGIPAELAAQCEEMVNVYLHGEDDPEVNDYEQYDNGVKIIGTYLCEPQMIDRDNYEILIDNGYYTEKEVERIRQRLQHRNQSHRRRQH